MIVTGFIQQQNKIGVWPVWFNFNWIPLEVIGWLVMRPNESNPGVFFTTTTNYFWISQFFSAEFSRNLNFCVFSRIFSDLGEAPLKKLIGHHTVTITPPDSLPYQQHFIKLVCYAYLAYIIPKPKLIVLSIYVILESIEYSSSLIEYKEQSTTMLHQLLSHQAKNDDDYI